MTNNPYTGAECARPQAPEFNSGERTGSSLDDFLQEEDLYEECTAIAIKRVLARQLEADRKKQGSVSRRLRLAASVVGRQLRIELV